MKKDNDVLTISLLKGLFIMLSLGGHLGVTMGARNDVDGKILIHELDVTRMMMMVKNVWKLYEETFGEPVPHSTELPELIR